MVQLWEFSSGFNDYYNTDQWCSYGSSAVVLMIITTLTNEAVACEKAAVNLAAKRATIWLKIMSF